MTSGRGWQGGSTRQWRHTRNQILRANEIQNSGFCTLALDGTKECPRHPGHNCAPCTITADTVHHIHGKTAGDNPDGLTATCAACNQHIGDPTATHIQPNIWLP